MKGLSETKKKGKRKRNDKKQKKNDDYSFLKYYFNL